MKLTALLVLLVTLLAVPAFAGTLVYANDFESGFGNEWSINTQEPCPLQVSTTPGGRLFLGEFVNQTLDLSLGALPNHNSVTISFDLFILKSWDGNDSGSGPDVWLFSVEGGPVLFQTTFSNIIYWNGETWANYHQSYPNQYPNGDYDAQTGAVEQDTLGYNTIPWGGYPRDYWRDSVYHLEYTIAHAQNDIRFDFSANMAGGNASGDETWGIDNVCVETTVVPEPSGLLALGTMLVPVGIGLIRKKK
jgi:hypothetical protein